MASSRKAAAKKPTANKKRAAGGASGQAAGKKAAKKTAPASKKRGPIDVPGFLKKLDRVCDAARLSKATKMLKASRFELFTELSDERLVGVVKSQTDADLVYSCRLDADGSFSCCTQNLNVCGGLRGALCKHLLVLIIGLAQAGEIDPVAMNAWVDASRKKKPALDRDLASEIFLRHKGAEAGEIDWRPTETIPEDFYAL